MTGFGGYFLGSMASGLKSGFNMGQMKWQQNEKKKLQKKQDEMMETSSVFNNMVSQLGEDGSYSEDDMMKINTSYMALGYDVKERVDGTYKAIQAMDKKTIEENYQWFDFVIEATNDMKSGDAQGIFDTVKPFISGEKGLQIYEGLESITKKKGEIAERPKEVSPYDYYGQSPAGVQESIAESVAGQTPGLEGVQFKQEAVTPEAPPTPKSSDYTSAVNYLSKFVNAKPEVFNSIKEGYQKQFPNMDISAITQQSLKEPERVVSGGAGGTPPPEGEVTAGQKRTYDMASSVMFGSSDWVTGISKPGIISQSISNKLNMGDKLTEEENTEVRNNYNAIKGTLPDEIKSVIESQLKRYGISLEAPAPTPTPPPEVKQPGMIEKGVTAVKDWLGKKEKDYTTMSEEELYKLAMDGDKLAYEEAKRRGIVK